MKNRISIVFTARNDDYGGSLLDRINASVRVLIYLTNKYKTEIELVIVEYNPPKEKRRLSDVVAIKNNKFLKVRFILFPASRHRLFVNSNRIKLFEYTAKNVGIRRATGEYIISTNQDIIFSEDFFKFVTKEKLMKKVFYRTDRVDVGLSPRLLRLPAAKLLLRCKKDAYLKKTLHGDRLISYTKVESLRSLIKNGLYLTFTFFYGLVDERFRKAKLNSNDYHIFAAGDFLMMHKDVWNKARGFDETKVGNDYLDGYLLFVLGCLGFRQEIIPYEMYHVDHLMSKAGRPSVSYFEFVRNCNKMLKTGKPYKQNDSDWGNKNTRFKENSISFSK